jgi:predicted DCC family thiol-disulfide oxidoreductase YuxK
MKVFFNNSCKICKAEINHYKKEKIKEIHWIDISNNRRAQLETNKTDKQLLRRLHVKKDGRIFIGAEAFLLIWKKIPKYKFLYNFLKLPFFFQVFSIGYEIIAFFLYLKNKHQIKN